MKKLLVFIFIAAMAAGLAGCSGQGAGDSQVVLNVYNWGDYIDEEVIGIFEEETGIKVIYDMFMTNEDMYTKIKSGGTNYDIAFPSDYMIEKMANEGMLQKIDIESLENYKHIDQRFKNLSFDVNNEYSVPYMWGTVGIVYNTEMVKEPVDSWNILWDEDYKDQILMLNSQRDSIGITLKKLNYSLNTRNMDELNDAMEELKRQKPLVLSYSGDNIKEQMISESAALAVMWSGDAQYVHNENPALEYVVPKEGSNVWFDGIVIPISSKHKKEAEMFIDFMCRPEIALKNTIYIGYTTANASAYELMDEEELATQKYIPTEDEIERCEIFYDLGDFVKEYNDIWTKILAN